MTKSHALTRIHETYTEDELLNGKDEPDTAIATHLIGSAKIFTLYDNGGPTGHATLKSTAQPSRATPAVAEASCLIP